MRAEWSRFFRAAFPLEEQDGGYGASDSLVEESIWRADILAGREPARAVESADQLGVRRNEGNPLGRHDAVVPLESEREFLSVRFRRSERDERSAREYRSGLQHAVDADIG